MRLLLSFTFFQKKSALQSYLPYSLFEPAQPKIKGTGITSLLRPFAIDSSLIVAVIALILIAATFMPVHPLPFLAENAPSFSIMLHNTCRTRIRTDEGKSVGDTIRNLYCTLNYYLDFLLL